MQWRRNPQQVAWAVLTTSFCFSCLLGVAVPLLIRDYLLHSAHPFPAQVTALTGTAQLWAPRADTPSAVVGSRPATEGSRVVTDGSARAVLTIGSDGKDQPPLVSAQLFQDTSVWLERAATPRFWWSRDQDQVMLRVERGRVHLANSPSEHRPMAVQISTPAARVELGSGTVHIAIHGDETQVMVRSGSAEVIATHGRRSVNSGERLDITLGKAPGAPVPAAVNLVRNGTFTSGIMSDWEEVHAIAPGLSPGKAMIQTVGERSAIQFERRTEDGQPNMIGTRQTLDRDVQAYDSLVLRLDLRILYQSVPAGGLLSSEYPVMVDITYTDIYGKELHWYQGFYYQDLPPGSTWKAPTGEKVPLGAWYGYESPNLLDLLRETRPARINAITISASGHDYESQVSDVALTVR